MLFNCSKTAQKVRRRCGVTRVKLSKCEGLAGFIFFQAVSVQLVPQFGNIFYTLDSVTKAAQEFARRVVAVFGVKNWHPQQSVGFELLVAAVC